ncbi:MAG: MATE family efflux transporter [Candidatus Spyradocola sp.]|nr:MATE family efflux transporter [Candidatus Spyradocola sp.]
MVRRGNGAVNSITEGNIWQQVLLYFFPILLGTFFQQMYNTVDAVIVGQFVGTQALAAVGGTVGTLINLLVGFFVGLSSGATVIIAQYWGSGDGKGVSKAVHTGIALSLAGGAVLTVVGLLFSRMALGWVSTPDDVIDLATVYMRIYFVGTIPSLIYNIGSSILRAVGDSKRPLYFLIICCVVNILLDLFFVVALKMGVTGVAIATILSQTVSAVLVVVTLMRSETSFRLYPKKIAFARGLLGQIVRIGLPAGLQSVMYSLSNTVLQAAINGFGTTVIAAYTAFGKLDGLFWMVIGAFGVTVTTFVGQNFGAQKFDRMRKSVRVCMTLSVIFTLALEALFYFGGELCMHLFSGDTAVILEGTRITRSMAPMFILYICIEILSGTMRGTGESFVPMLMTCFGVCVTRVLWVAFVVPHFDDVMWVLYSYPVSWTLTSLMFIAYYFKGGWFKRRMLAHGFSLEESSKKA